MVLLFLFLSTEYIRLYFSSTFNDGFIYLLPALPAQWKEGSVNGIIARGGFELDLSWKNSKVNRLVVKSHKGGELSFAFFKSAGRQRAEEWQKGKIRINCMPYPKSYSRL